MVSANVQMLEQGTEQWLEARRGVFTASVSSEIVSDPRKAPSLTKTALRLIRKKALEQITTEEIDPVFLSPAMQLGKEREPEAALVYSQRYEVQLIETGLTLWSESDEVGASFDRVIKGWEGAIEIKCPGIMSHALYLEMETVDDLYRQAKGYYWQIVHQMLVGGFEYIDFVSYYPSFEICDLKVLRVERTPKIEGHIRHLIHCLNLASEKKKEFIAMYQF